jgi:hypothetical protein
MAVLQVRVEKVLKVENVEMLIKLQSEAKGYFVIDDKPTAISRLHLATCSHVKVRHYETKVVENGGKNGDYYWSELKPISGTTYRLVECSECRR